MCVSESSYCLYKLENGLKCQFTKDEFDFGLLLQSTLESIRKDEKMEESNISGSYFPLISRLTYRCLWERKKNFVNTTYLLSLLTYAENLPYAFGPEAQAVQDILSLAGFSGDELSSYDSNWYSRLWGVLALNAMRTPTGLALFGLPSMMNHSCLPTVGMKYSGDFMSLVASRDLEPGDEISINYVEILQENERWNMSQTLQYLHQNYGFDCLEHCTCHRKKTTPDKSEDLY